MDPEAYKKYNRKEQGAALGVYRHPDTKEELICQEHPLADAVVRQGWEWARELPSAKELRNVAPTATESAEDVTGVDANKDANDAETDRAKKAARAKKESN